MFSRQITSTLHIIINHNTSLVIH